ncbi:hypothetical protein SDC9_142298 [bioreactor metagenome]|uniref:SGNH hydrolase-type esterase domain-containing protein n=1 Tax=bioreactor metagenome TaxID=1076179 RepID=A0A645E0H2_9ZZZZ
MYRVLEFLSILLITFSLTPASAQESKREVKFKGAYYEVRRAAHDLEGMPKGAVVFVGNSITEQGWWPMLFKTNNIINRGIGGDNTFGMLDRFADILKFEPRKIFFMGGINDLTAGLSQDTIIHNIRTMIKMCKEKSPSTEFYLQSVLPVNDARLAYPAIKGKNKSIKELNVKLNKLAEECGVTFVNVAPLLSDNNGELELNLTKDGIHLHPDAYLIWSKHLRKMRYLR